MQDVLRVGVVLLAAVASAASATSQTSSAQSRPAYTPEEAKRISEQESAKHEAEAAERRRAEARREKEIQESDQSPADLSFLQDDSTNCPAPTVASQAAPCPEHTGAGGRCCSVVTKCNACTPEDLAAEVERADQAQVETEKWKASLATTRVGRAALPSNFKALATSFIKGMLKDPYSAKFRRITKPERAYVIVDEVARDAVLGWSVCIEVNAKNSFGGYVGYEYQGVFIVRGKAVALWPDCAQLNDEEE